MECPSRGPAGLAAGFHRFNGTTPLYKAAVVAGATGATGRYIVGQLLSQGVAEKTIALSRRALKDPQAVATALSLSLDDATKHLDSGRLEIQVVDFDRLVKERKPQWDPPDADLAFCAMGSAPYTELSDFTLPAAFAAAVAGGHAAHMGLVSSQGASTSSWVGYCRCLGRREEEFQTHAFPLGLSIWRPGMLDRGELSAGRLKERLANRFLPSSMHTSTQDLAAAIVAEAVRVKETDPKGAVTVYESDVIKKIIKALHG